MSDFEANGSFGNLNYFNIGLDVADVPLVTGRDFERLAERLVDEPVLQDHIDTAMSGHSSPRIWVFLDGPGDNVSASVAALSAARTLADRGQTAIVIDGDDTNSSLTRGVGRFELEGWIDLVRYGTSLLASSCDLPFPGKKSYLLGVGSFHPTQITPEEIIKLMETLRHQGDDVIVVLPHGSKSIPWTRVADIRLLCWDQTSQARSDIDAIIEDLESSGCPLTGLVGFGEAGDEVSEPTADHSADAGQIEEQPPPEVDQGDSPREEDAIAESEPAPPGETVGEPDWTRRIEAEQADDETSQFDTGIEVAPGYQVNGNGFDAEEAVDTQSPPADADAAEGAADVPWQTGNTARNSSSIFKVLAVVLFIVATGIGGYWFLVLREPSVDFSDTNTIPPATVAGTSGITGGSVEGDVHQEAAELATVDSPVSSGPDNPDRIDTAQDEEQTASTVVGTVPAQPVVDQSVDDQPMDEPVAELDMAQFSVPVGQDGWALHIYSFPDSTIAMRQIAALVRRGYQAEYRAHDLSNGRGRWYRVYIGSYESRELAWTAVPLIKQELRVDWVMPESF